MAKDKKNKHRKPNLSPLAALRPRLDGLIQNPGWLDYDTAKIQADLAAVSNGITLADLIPVFLRVLMDVDDSTRQKLSPHMAEFLQTQGGFEVLATLHALRQLPLGSESVVGDWLQQVGIELAATSLATSEPSTFYRAYHAVDQFGSQGILTFLWYANRQRTRVASMQWMLDFNPPWEGSAKDVLAVGQKTPEEMERTWKNIWPEHVLQLKEVSASEAKRLALEALTHNQEEGIRLHNDFQQVREDFARHVLTLPDEEETPEFTLEDFDYLLKHGKSSESINQYELKVGRRVRMEDGKEVFVGADVFEDE